MIPISSLRFMTSGHRGVLAGLDTTEGTTRHLMLAVNRFAIVSYLYHSYWYTQEIYKMGCSYAAMQRAWFGYGI